MPNRSSHSPMNSRLSRTAAGAVLGIIALSAAPQSATAQVKQAGMPAVSGELATVRSGLDKYRDPIVAVREGFLSTLACIDFPTDVMDGNVPYKAGTMGVHFINMANVGPTLDPTKPQVLIYEPVGDRLQLVSAEWFVPAGLVKDGKAPKIFGQTMQGPMPGHTPIMPAELQHYDLHVWLWRDNPRGMFEPTNASVKCPKGAAYTHSEKGSHATHKP
jgi:hypothetical protein